MSIKWVWRVPIVLLWALEFRFQISCSRLCRSCGRDFRVAWLGVRSLALGLQWLGFRKGPCNQYLSTWDLGNSNYSTGFG